MGLRGAPKKRERRTTAVRRTPTKGYTNQHMADAPDRERGPSAAFVFQEPEGSGWWFPAKQRLTLARHFNCGSRVRLHESRSSNQPRSRLWYDSTASYWSIRYDCQPHEWPYRADVEQHKCRQSRALGLGGPGFSAGFRPALKPARMSGHRRAQVREVRWR